MPERLWTEIMRQQLEGLSEDAQAEELADALLGPFGAFGWLCGWGSDRTITAGQAEAMARLIWARQAARDTGAQTPSRTAAGFTAGLLARLDATGLEDQLEEYEDDIRGAVASYARSEITAEQASAILERIGQHLGRMGTIAAGSAYAKRRGETEADARRRHHGPAPVL